MRKRVQTQRFTSYHRPQTIHLYAFCKNIYSSEVKKPQNRNEVLPVPRKYLVKPDQNAQPGCWIPNTWDPAVPLKIVSGKPANEFRTKPSLCKLRKIYL